MRLIPLVFTRLYAVSVDRQESISFFMWECKTCITRDSCQPLIGHHIRSRVTGSRRETSSVSLLTGFPLIRATRWRLSKAFSDWRFRTNQRADSEYHLINHTAHKRLQSAGPSPFQNKAQTQSRAFPLTSCRRRRGTGVNRRPTAPSASLSASRQTPPGPTDQRWRRRRWLCLLKFSLWLGSTPPLETEK